MRLGLSDRALLWVALLALGSAVSGRGEAAEMGAAQAKAPAKTFSVVSATKAETHPHHGEGSKVGFVVDGVQGRTLVLVRGNTYTFNIDTGVQHDFYLSTDPVGWGSGTLVAGVDGNFTYKGVVTFKPTAETPDVVYYQCRNHKYMGGTIHIVNPGEEGKIKIAEPAPAATADQKQAPVLDRNEVKDRLSYGDMFVSKSEAAKRITASDNDKAKAGYQEARNKLAAAKAAFDSDRLQEAKANVDEAIALMTEATRQVPSEAMQEKAKSRYTELLRGLETLEESYKRNYDVSASEGSAKGLQKLDSEDIRRMTDSARALFEQRNYEAANKIVADAQAKVSNALNALLANRTISYKVEFTSTAGEYEHELARFAHYEELIPSALQQKEESQATLALMESYVKNGQAKRDQAIAEAKQQNFVAALDKIKNGIEQLQRALQVLGVRY